MLENRIKERWTITDIFAVLKEGTGKSDVYFSILHAHKNLKIHTNFNLKF